MTDYGYLGLAWLAQGALRGLDVRLDLVGQEHIPATGGGVVVINHIGYLDFAVVLLPFWRAGRPVRFMGKQELFTHRLGGPMLRAARQIPVDRGAGAASFRKAVEMLRLGELVGVFPEATISRSFCLKEFKSGAARMARAAGVPLIPVTHWGSQRLWTKERRPAIHAARHIPISVTIGTPIRPGRGGAIDTELVEVMNDLLERSRARYPAAPGDDPWWLPAHLGGTAPTPEQAAELDAEERLRRTRHHMARTD